MWDAAEYERLAAVAVPAVARWVLDSETGESPPVDVPPLAELIEELDLRRLMREGGLDAERFEDWLATMLAHSTRLHHPGELAHQVVPPDVPAAVSDLVQGVINQPMSIYEMGRAPTPWRPW
jgi:L-2,4-diaminobutyrate decarboxylase